MGPGWRRGPELESAGNLLEEDSTSLSESTLQFCRPRYMLSWHVFTIIKWTLGQRKTSVFALIVRRLWKLFRLPKQRLHRYNSIERRWTTFPPGTLWGCFGSLDILGYSTRRWICRQARMRGYCSPVCWTGPDLGGLWAEYKKKDKRLDGHLHMAMWRGLISIQRQAP